MFRDDLDQVASFQIPLKQAKLYYTSSKLSDFSKFKSTAMIYLENTCWIQSLVSLWLHSPRVRSRENSLNDMQLYNYDNQAHGLSQQYRCSTQTIPLSYLAYLYVDYGYSPRSERPVIKLGYTQKREIINKIKQIRRAR